MADNISITKLPAASEVKSGDFIILETSTGTQIIDYKDFVIGQDNVTFWPRLTDNTTNIKSVSTIQGTLSSDIDVFRTLVSEVSGLSGIIWKSAWSSATTYKISHSVSYNNSSFVAVTENTNQQPVNSADVLNSNWNYLAKAGTSTLTQKGGMLAGVGDGSSVQIAPGASGYILTAKGSGSQVVWERLNVGTPGSLCTKLPIFNNTANAGEWNFHWLMSDGTVKYTGEGYGTGAGFLEQYDHQSANPHPVTMPAEYDYQSAEHKILDIYKDHYHTFIVTVSGHVYGAGNNGVGQLGVGSTSAEYTFRKITFPDAGVRIQKIVSSHDDGTSGATTYFIARDDLPESSVNDGRVYACGDNNSGQIGDGTTTDRTSPIRVGTLTQVDELWAWGGAETAVFARVADGRIYAWGDVQGTGYSGVMQENGSQAANQTSPQLQGAGFTPGDTEALKGLNSIKDMRVHRSYDGSSAYARSTFALLTSGHVYSIGYNDAYRQLGFADNTQRTVFTCVSGVSAVQSFDTHQMHSRSSCIATCSAIIGGTWNQGTHKYEGFTDVTATSGILLRAWGGNASGHLGDGSTTTFAGGPRIMNPYLPTTICNAVSSVICEAKGRANGEAWTYIRDLSGYYWFAGGDSHGLSTMNNSNETGTDTTTTDFRKISLPCHPNDIKEFKSVQVNATGSVAYKATVILTHDGRAYAIGGPSLQYMFGTGYNESATSNHARAAWHQVQF